MPDVPDSVRIEVAFAGGPITAANVSPASADALEHALAAGSQGTHQLDTDDGRMAIVLARSRTSSALPATRGWGSGSRPGYPGSQPSRYGAGVRAGKRA